MAILLMFATTLVISSEWEFGARLVPTVVGWAGVLFTGWLILSGLFVAPALERGAASGPGATAGDAFKAAQGDVHFDIQADYGDLDVKTIFRRAANYFGWLLFFFGAAAVVGLLPAMFLFLAGYMRFEGKEPWPYVIAIATGMWIFCYFLFHKLLIIPWPQTVIGDLFPAVRSIAWLNLF